MKNYFALTVAGSDCSGGAGVQADLKTFARMQVYGASALTCVVAEHASHVGSVVEISPPVVAEQIKLCGEAFALGAVKTGMLPSGEIISAVADSLKSLGIALVVDPVMVASTGTRLISEEAFVAMKKKLLPLCTVMTPNLDEAAWLLNRDGINSAEFDDSATELAQIFGCAVFLKGGHLSGSVARDVLVHGGGLEVYESEKIEGVNTHGTGCTLSAALTAALARGKDLCEACGTAKKFVMGAIRNSAETKLGKLLNHQFT